LNAHNGCFVSEVYRTSMQLMASQLFANAPLYMGVLVLVLKAIVIQARAAIKGLEELSQPNS